MRLYLLPISTRRTLIYCEPRAMMTSPTSKPSILDRVVVKANTTWADWEKNTDSYMNWKKRTTDYGNILFRRIPYEEWGLKSIPPSQRKSGRLKEEGVGSQFSSDKVQVHFPGLYHGLCKESLLDTLKRLSTEREGLHRKKMWYSIVGMPITAPIGLLPIIPNLPFFYLMFRAYSHWKALKGSQHLAHLLLSDLLLPKPSTALDNLYTAGLLYPTRAVSRDAPEPTLEQSKVVVEMLRQQTSPGTSSSDEQSTNVKQASPTLAAAKAPEPTATSLRPGMGKKLHTGQEEVMLLQGWNGKLLAERLKLPGLEIEIERAVEQVQDSIRKGEGELMDEKKELEELTRKFRTAQKPAKA